jgi:hypothetical protein
MKNLLVFGTVLLGLATVGCAGPTRQQILNYPVVVAPSIDRNYYSNITTTIPDPPDVTLPTTTSVRIVPVYQGQVSPFNGILLDAQASAFLQVSFNSQRRECVVNRRADLDRLATRALTDIDLFQAALTEQQQQSTVLLRGRDQEIERLVSGQGNNNVLNYTLASAAGLVVGFGLFGSLYALVK